MRIKKLNPEAETPTRGSDGAAAYDIYTPEDVSLIRDGITKVETGIAIEIPKGHVGLIRERSSHAVKGVIVQAGVIDEDYRGEVVVVMRNYNGRVIEILAGDRVAQMLVIPIYQSDVEVVDELNDTDRGDGGFGSTGA